MHAPRVFALCCEDSGVDNLMPEVEVACDHKTRASLSVVVPATAVAVCIGHDTAAGPKSRNRTLNSCYQATARSAAGIGL